MKLRLTEANFDKYNGQMGAVDFANGLSTKDVLPKDALRISAAIGAEWEDGTPTNISQVYLDSMNNEAPTDEEQASAANPDMPKTKDDMGMKTKIAYTEEQLAAIADEKGISGLREIADPIGIKSNSIRTLIDAILKAAPVEMPQI